MLFLNRSLNNKELFLSICSFLLLPLPLPNLPYSLPESPFLHLSPPSRAPAGQRAEVLWNSCISSSSAPSPHSRGESTCQLSLPRASQHLEKCTARAALPWLLHSLKARLPSRGSERTLSFLCGLQGLCTILTNWAWKKRTEETEGKG